MMRCSLLLGAATALALAAAPRAACAQSPKGDSLVNAALDRARAGDTAAALKLLERATKVAPQHAPAFYHRGMLLERTSSLGLSDVLRRREAWQQINRALDLDRDNPFYLMELGRIRLKTPLLRLDAERLFGKALRAAQQRNDARVLGEVQWEIGQIHERRYLAIAHRHMLIGAGNGFDPSVAIGDHRYTPDFLEQRAQPVPDAGELDFRKAEDYYRAALVADPAHRGAAVGLFGLLYDAGRYQEMVRLARELERPQRDHGRLWMALGLALHRLDRSAEAERAFDSALVHLPAAERRDMLALEPLMRNQQAREYRGMSDPERAQTDSVFWDLADPLKLTAVNEARVEFLARLAFADLRYSAAEFNIRGWQSDRGVIVLRYGIPPRIATFAPEVQSTTLSDGSTSDALGRITTVFYYPETRMRFVFVGPPAMNTAMFAGDFRAYAENARHVAPVRFDNIAPRLHVDSVPVQVARFRADPPAGGAAATPAGADVVLFADLPTGKMLAPLDVAQSSVQTGLFLTDNARRSLATVLDSALVRPGTTDAVTSRSWRRRLLPGEYLYRVEAREPGSGRGARGLAAFDVAPFPAGALSMSDILVARGISPRTEAPRTRDDFLIRPNGAMTYAPGDTLFLYWENYGITGDKERVGRIRVDLALRVTALDRGRSFQARVLGGLVDAVGLSAQGEDRVALRYERSVAIEPADRVVNYLALGIGEAPYGTYTVELTVTDLTTGKATRQTRTITVPRP